MAARLLDNGRFSFYWSPSFEAADESLALLRLFQQRLFPQFTPASPTLPNMVTAARTSSYGNMLMLVNMAEAPDTEFVDLSEYNPVGGTGTIYRMTATALTQGSISGTSTQLTFAPGETIRLLLCAKLNTLATLSDQLLRVAQFHRFGHFGHSFLERIRSKFPER
jgi:hypothetical protein